MGEFDRPLTSMCNCNMNPKCASALSITFAAIAAIFVLCACVAYDDDCTNVKNTAWAQATFTGYSTDGLPADVTCSIGLRGVAISGDSSDSSNESECVLYESFEDIIKQGQTIIGSLVPFLDVVEDCRDSGKGAVGMAILSLLMIAAGTIMGFTRCCASDSQCLRIAAIIVHIFGGLLALIAVAVFQVACVNQINSKINEVDPRDDDAPTFYMFFGGGACIVAGLLAKVAGIFHACGTKNPTELAMAGAYVKS